MADPFSLDFYLIIRPRLLTRKYDIRDRNGNVLFQASPNLLNTEVTITNPSGAVVGETRQKILAISPTFQLYDGSAKSGKLIGMIKKPVMENLIGIKLDLSDQNGNVIAKASGGMFQLGPTSYSIADGSGNLIGQVGAELGNSILSTLGNLAKDAYSLQIMQPGTVPTLLLIEFLLCIELLRGETSRRGGAGGIRMGGSPGAIQL